MTIASTINRVSYIGNGNTDTYAYTFRIFEDDDLLVTVKDTDDVETTLVKTTDYTVTGVGGSSGNVVLVNASQAWLDVDGDLKSNYELVIRRVRPLTQETDIRNQGSFFPSTHEDVFDHLMMIAQQHQDEIDRSIKLPETVAGSGFDTLLPSDGLAANTVLLVNSTGDGFTTGPTADEISDAQSQAAAAAASAAAAAASAASINNWLGTSLIQQTTFTIANNIGSATDVTGLLFSSASCKSAKVHGALRRKTDTASSEVLGYFDLILMYSNQDSAWYLVSVREDNVSSSTGVTFTVTSAGQVQYVSTNIAGANYAGEFKFKAEVFNA